MSNELLQYTCEKLLEENKKLKSGQYKYSIELEIINKIQTLIEDYFSQDIVYNHKDLIIDIYKIIQKYKGREE